MKFEFLGEIYQDDNGKEVFDVKVGNATLKGLEAAKRGNLKCSNCEYRNCDQEIVFRKYDCPRKVNRLGDTYKIFTTMIVAGWAYFVFSYFEFGFFYKMALLVLSLTGLDIVCTFVEESVPKIYDWLFCRKLKKLLKVQKKQKEAEQAKIKAEEEAKFKEIPCYPNIKKARTITQEFCEIAKQCDYGSNTFNINCCVESCEVIMKILEKDPFYYYRVSDVFEYYLPRVCATIGMYKRAVETSTKTEQQEILFTEFIENVTEYLGKKKDEAIYYNNGAEINLKSSTDILRKSLQEEIKK